MRPCGLPAPSPCIDGAAGAAAAPLELVLAPPGSSDERCTGAGSFGAATSGLNDAMFIVPAGRCSASADGGGGTTEGVSAEGARVLAFAGRSAAGRITSG